MTMIGKDFPVRAYAFLLSSEMRANSAAISPADTLCFDIFSPPPGDNDVTSQVDRLSSNETKIAPRSVRIAVFAPVDGVHRDDPALLAQRQAAQRFYDEAVAAHAQTRTAMIKAFRGYRNLF